MKRSLQVLKNIVTDATVLNNELLEIVNCDANENGAQISALLLQERVEICHLEMKDLVQLLTNLYVTQLEAELNKAG